MAETQSVRELAKSREPRKSAVDAAASISNQAASGRHRKRAKEDQNPGPSNKSSKKSANGISARNCRPDGARNIESDQSSVDSSSDGMIF